MSDSTRASAAVLGAALLFGTTGTAQALGPDGTTPLGVGTLRIVVGAVALWAFAGRSDPAQPSRAAELRRHLPLFAVGAAGVAGYQPAFFTGTARSGVALGTMVALGSGPLFTGAIEALLFRRTPTRSWWTATALTVAGGCLLVVGGGATGASADALGVLGSLGAGLSYAVYAVAASRLIRRGVQSTVALAWPFTLGALALAPTLAGEPLDWLGRPGGWAMLAHLGVATVGLAYFLYGFGLRTLDPATAVTLTLAEPLTAALLGVVLLDERLGGLGWVGAALVLVGLAVAGGLLDRRPRRGGGTGPRRTAGRGARGTPAPGGPGATAPGGQGA